MPSRERQPLGRLVRCRIVAKADSIGLLVRMPMLSSEVEECHEFCAVFLQTQRRLGILWLIDFDEQIECLVGILFSLGLPPSRDIAAQCPAGQWILWIAVLALG